MTSTLHPSDSSPASPVRLLIAASGTGGHVFPAIATAEQLPDYQIEWLGVPDRLETRLVPSQYPLHTVPVEGFQKRGLGTVRVLAKFVTSIWQVRGLLKKGQFQGVFTTGGYIAAPAIIAAKSLGLPTILHESNAIPGKVTRWLSPWCDVTALGFAEASNYLSGKTVQVGTPVRSQFRAQLGTEGQPLDLPIPEDVPVIVVVGGSQGAVAVNRLVRECAPAWFTAGAWVVHLTGDNDPDVDQLQHSQYIALPFYGNMAGLLKRADLAVSRSGAGTLTELAATHTPSILIPFPFAAEDHQTYNAKTFVDAGAAIVFQQADLTPEILTTEVLRLLRSDDSPLDPQSFTAEAPVKTLQTMAYHAEKLAITDSAERLANLIRQQLKRVGSNHST